MLYDPNDIAARMTPIKIAVTDHSDDQVKYQMTCDTQDALKLEGIGVHPFTRKDGSRELFVVYDKTGKIIQHNDKKGMSVYHFLGREVYQFSPINGDIFDVRQSNMDSRRQKATRKFKNKAR